MHGSGSPLKSGLALTGDVQLSPTLSSRFNPVIPTQLCHPDSTLSSRPEQIIAKRWSVEWRDLAFNACIGRRLAHLCGFSGCPIL